LADCSTDISREHYISHCILKALTENGSMTVDGFPWQSTKQQRMSPTGMVSHILCKRHNEALSGLDSESLRLFGALDRAFHSCEVENWGILLRGQDLERWMLKTLIGMTCSKNARYNNAPITSKPNLPWLRWLFGMEAFPSACGLYFGGQVGDPVHAQRSVSIAPLVSDAVSIEHAGFLFGAMMTVCGVNFVLNLAPPEPELTTSPVIGYIYRPAAISITKDGVNGQIVFAYEEVGTVVVEMVLVTASD
jgi:hypothetical protein